MADLSDYGRVGRNFVRRMWYFVRPLARVIAGTAGGAIVSSISHGPYRIQKW